MSEAAADLQAALDDGLVLRWYTGPADVLCRVLAGDVITFQDFVTDESPFVRTLLHAGIVERIRFMAERRD